MLAADQRISWWARQLKKAGLDGSMDELRARAYLDILLDKDSRPAPPAGDGSAAHRAGPDSPGTDDHGTDGNGADDGGPGDGGPGPGGGTRPAPSGPASGAIPPGFAGRINLTVPLTTVLGLADRPGEIPGIGPIDPDPGANT